LRLGWILNSFHEPKNPWQDEISLTIANKAYHKKV